MPLGEDEFACHEVLTHRAHVLPGKSGPHDLHGLDIDLMDLLDHDHGIGPRRQRVSGIHEEGLLAHPQFFGAVLRRPKGDLSLQRNPVHGRTVIVG